jgi:VanZ family protein
MKLLLHLPRWCLLLIWATVVILFTTLPQPFPIVRTLARLLGGNDVGDAIGHASLFGSMTLLVYWTLRLRLGFSFAFWLAIGSVLALSTATEFSQQFTAGRTLSLSDLLANWVGVLAVATVVCFHIRISNRQA